MYTMKVITSTAFVCIMCLYSLCAAQEVSSTVAPPPKSFVTPPSSTAAPAACAGSMKVVVPLMMAPGPAWDEVAAGARFVQTIAILHPNNNNNNNIPTYNTYMSKLHDAGVVMVGYVDTNYGRRGIDAVKADIDTLASEYPLLSGIFLDHTSALTSQLTYYNNLHTYILSMPGWEYDVINPGMIPDSGYLSVSTHIVSFDDYASSLTTSSTPQTYTCGEKERYMAMVHSVGKDAMEASVDALINKNYIGYIYLTDSAATFTHFSSYYSSMISYVALKQQKLN